MEKSLVIAGVVVLVILGVLLFGPPLHAYTSCTGESEGYLACLQYERAARSCNSDATPPSDEWDACMRGKIPSYSGQETPEPLPDALNTTLS